MVQLLFKDRAEFRAWLAQNALSDQGVWLVFSKRKDRASIKAAEALEEALCFGWIDGRMERIDEDSYVKYFKQRGRSSVWSEKNKKLAEELEQNGLMTDFGRAKIAEARRSGHWDRPKPEALTDGQLRQFEAMLLPYESAYANFMGMSRSVRRTYAASYFLGAKTEEGRRRRFDTVIERLNLNLNPMESGKKKTEG